jgi:phosphatidylglycerol:prolipoprotein diacylglycerol transferase
MGYAFGGYDLPEIQGLVSAGALQPRHPSQLYQAFAEGFLVFGIMLLLRRTNWGKRLGALSAAYLVLYAFARIAMEFFREPDEGRFLIGWITKGQFYSMLMIAGALIICWKKHLIGVKNSQAD